MVSIPRPAPAARRLAPLLAAALALGLAAAPADAEIAGKPQVVDGGTIALAGRRVTLYGIAAPAEGELCGAAGRRWRCGQGAAFALARIVETHWVHCAARGGDDDGRVVAVCRLGGPDGPDVAAEMVRQGWARADRRAAPAYAAAEDAARAARAGLWGGAPPP